ncbi:MAG: DUF4965 domain-containing protein [Paludibacter sp.]|nr:DUF4965 domain-containing protein [Paludibacter sp.]
MKKPLLLLMLSLSMLAVNAKKPVAQIEAKPLRAPAVPLLTSDPYFSVWSASDQLSETATTHWTGKVQSLIGALRVDGKTYRFLGQEVASYTPVLPSGEWEGQFTEQKPAANWADVNFADGAWKTGKGSFGNNDAPRHSTNWESKDIWIRRTFDLKENISAEPLFIEYSHDDIFELFVNGVKLVDTGYTWRNNVYVELDAKIKSLLKPGKNVIAAHCHNEVGGAFVDFGLMKKDNVGDGFATKAIQKSVKVLPTNSVYSFVCGPVQLEVTFTAPVLLEDLDLVSTPINYVSYKATSLDKKAHDVQIYFEATPQLAVNFDNQPIKFEKITKNNFTYLKTGTINQPILGQVGDDMRIDWGYLYFGGQLSGQENLSLADYYAAKKSFIETGKSCADVCPKTLSANMKEKMSVLAYTNNLGAVSKDGISGHLMVGYDDLYSIQYFYENLMPYWKHNGKVDIFQAFEKAEKSYTTLMSRCTDFDKKMLADAEKVGGKEYAELCALAYRQAIVAHKLVQDKDGNLLFLSKENNSNGCINTVDVTYPSAPLFLLYNPELMKGMLTSIFHYSESGRWTKPFPAHDLGTYPIANGQLYGGDMPVEEGGNMLLLTTAVAYAEGNAEYARKHWDVLTVWADYLIKAGLDPESQLCTDDFAGHLAHNTNLSVKAILGIAGFGKMAAMLGKDDIANKYISTAKEMASKWISMANDGDHYRLTFDRTGTWSQKYNLVWDKVLDMGIFPKEVAQKEIAFYLTKQNKFGLPLDSRKTYTKSDWIIWTATLADSPADFNKIVAPVYTYVNETTSRVPLCDWHETTTGSAVGFKARSVVGGYFMKMLEAKMKTTPAK